MSPSSMDEPLPTSAKTARAATFDLADNGTDPNDATTKSEQSNLQAEGQRKTRSIDMAPPRRQSSRSRRHKSTRDFLPYSANQYEVYLPPRATGSRHDSDNSRRVRERSRDILEYDSPAMYRRSESSVEDQRILTYRGRERYPLVPLPDGPLIRLPDEPLIRDIRVEELARELAKKEKAIRRLERETSDLANDNIDLQRQLEGQDERVRRIQEQSLKAIDSKGFSRAEDDNTIRHKIQSCMRRLQSWAKTYAVSSKDDIREANRRVANDLFLSNLVPDKVNAESGLFSPLYEAIAPGIILNAVLALFVSQWIIDQPFFCLGNASISSPGSTNDLLRVSQAFDLVYRNAQLQGKRPLLSSRPC